MTALVRTRMFRVLACLIVTMTATSTGLDMFYSNLHGSASDAASVVEKEWLRAAEAAVGSPSVPCWQAVELLVLGNDESRHAFTQAVHFRVDANGAMHRTAFWEQQYGLDVSPGCVRVAVVGDTEPRLWPARQRLAVSSLLSALNRSLNRAPDQGLPVRGWVEPIAVAAADHASPW